MLHRLLENHLTAIETAVAQLQDIQIDRYREEVLASGLLNLRNRIRFTKLGRGN